MIEWVPSVAMVHEFFCCDSCDNRFFFCFLFFVFCFCFCFFFGEVLVDILLFFLYCWYDRSTAVEILPKFLCSLRLPESGIKTILVCSFPSFFILFLIIISLFSLSSLFFLPSFPLPQIDWPPEKAFLGSKSR